VGNTYQTPALSSQFGVRLMLPALNLLKQELRSGNCKMALTRFLALLFLLVLAGWRLATSPAQS
jgi:hypothetical protein